MTLNPKYFRRRSIRLKGYDYTQSGAYFVTICAHRWVNLFGEVVDGKMILNVLGRIVEEKWRETPEIRSYVDLDGYVVMPNHLHGIIMIVNGRGTMHRAPTVERFGKPVSGSLPTILRAFKAAVTRRINRKHCTPGQPV